MDPRVHDLSPSNREVVTLRPNCPRQECGGKLEVELPVVNDSPLRSVLGEADGGAHVVPTIRHTWRLTPAKIFYSLGCHDVRAHVSTQLIFLIRILSKRQVKEFILVAISTSLHHSTQGDLNDRFMLYLLSFCLLYLSYTNSTFMHTQGIPP